MKCSPNNLFCCISIESAFANFRSHNLLHVGTPTHNFTPIFLFAQTAEIMKIAAYHVMYFQPIIFLQK